MNLAFRQRDCWHDHMQCAREIFYTYFIIVIPCALVCYSFVVMFFRRVHRGFMQQQNQNYVWVCKRREKLKMYSFALLKIHLLHFYFISFFACVFVPTLQCSSFASFHVHGIYCYRVSLSFQHRLISLSRRIGSMQARGVRLILFALCTVTWALRYCMRINFKQNASPVNCILMHFLSFV